MKYIKLHIVLWAILCFVYTALELLVYIIANILNFIWAFRVIKWSDIFYSETYTWLNLPYRDKHPIDTFKRHYNLFKTMQS